VYINALFSESKERLTAMRRLTLVLSIRFLSFTSGYYMLPLTKVSTKFLPNIRFIHSNLFSSLTRKPGSSISTSGDDIELTTENLFDFELPTNEKNLNLLKFRHSTAHIMAMAVQKLFPQTRTAIGPWTDNG
jgi:hypothetical protein